MTTRQAGGIALVLIVASMLLSSIFQSVLLLQERSSLAQLNELQDKPLHEALSQRRRFDALVAGVTDLAAAGDGGAKNVVEEMRRQGLDLQAAARR